MFRQLRSAIIGLVLLAMAPALLAQGACPAIVQQALEAADELCVGTGRNQACYGHTAIEAVPQVDSVVNFDAAGDIENLAAIQSLKLHPMDTVSQTWGVALLRLQANLPGTLPGQNVTFLMFGDVEITHVTAEVDGDDDTTPMQAFLLRTGIGDSQCDEAPDSGLMVQTPEDVGEVTFNINGVDIAMGSTVVFRAQADGDMTVATIEGLAIAEVDDEVQPVLAGSRLRVPLDPTLRPARKLANPPEPYELRRLQGIPTRLLQREVEIARPLTQQQVNRMTQRMLSGESICGGVGLPSCDRIPRSLLARAMKASRARFEDQLGCVFRRGASETSPAGESRPFCDEQPPETLPCVFVPGADDQPLPANETRPFCPQLPDDTTLRDLRPADPPNPTAAPARQSSAPAQNAANPAPPAEQRTSPPDANAPPGRRIGQTDDEPPGQAEGNARPDEPPGRAKGKDKPKNDK
ncbi:MAG: hypothetical protein CL610_01545 [Anaerolineaceae bacterium]|nr:hypothetical protein [Anaerolineaceae bacterium]